MPIEHRSHIIAQHALHGVIAGLIVLGLSFFSTRGEFDLVQKIIFSFTIFFLLIQVSSLIWLSERERRASFGDTNNERNELENKVRKCILNPSSFFAWFSISLLLLYTVVKYVWLVLVLTAICSFLLTFLLNLWRYKWLRNNIVSIFVAIGTIAMAVATFFIIYQDRTERHFENQAYVSFGLKRLIPSCDIDPNEIILSTKLARGFTVELKNWGKTQAENLNYIVYCNNKEIVLANKDIGLLDPGDAKEDNTPMPDGNSVFDFIDKNCNNKTFSIEVTYVTYHGEDKGGVISYNLIDGGGLARQSRDKIK